MRGLQVGRMITEIEHICLRPGMYIKRLGDGQNPNDGIYYMLKAIVDNSIGEFAKGYGSRILIDVNGKDVSVRDFGRGISMCQVMDIISGDTPYVREIGQRSRINPLGILAVNALSENFYLCSYCDGNCSWIRYKRGQLQEQGTKQTEEKDGTLVAFTPDSEIFGDYAYYMGYVETMFKDYSYLNNGLTLMFNDIPFKSEQGLLGLVNNTIPEEPLYHPIHLVGKDIEVVITHCRECGATISSFVNGQKTRCGGTHLKAYREAVQKTLNDFFKEKYKRADCMNGLVGAINIKLPEPFFETPERDKLSSIYMSEMTRFGTVFTGQTIREFINDFISKNLRDYLQTHLDLVPIIEKKIKDSLRERELHMAREKAGKEDRLRSNKL